MNDVYTTAREIGRGQDSNLSPANDEICVQLVPKPTEQLPSVLMASLKPAALQVEKQPGRTASPGRTVSARGLSSL